jgi:hypothetical protein
MFHVELRQFPHNFNRFNLSESELAPVLAAWVAQACVELGERLWDPRQATLTVIEGERLSMPELAMGRGWRNAQRRGSDVTARVLAQARAGAGAGAGAAAAGELAGAAGVGPDATAQVEAGREGRADPQSGPVGEAPELAELLARLGEDALALIRAWTLALERHPDRRPSECLALAEELMRG